MATPWFDGREHVRAATSLSLALALAACTSSPVAPIGAAPATPVAAGTSEPASEPDPAVVAAAQAAAQAAAAVSFGDDGRSPLPQIDVDVDVAIESTRSAVRSTAEWLARGVDSWFGDQPFENGGKVSDGRATIALSKREGENPDFSLRFNARFRLPNLERLGYVFIGRDNPRENVSDRPGALADQARLRAETRDDSSFFAGLGRTLSDAIDLRLGFHGVRPYAQARYRRDWELAHDHLIEFGQTLFWTVQDSFGSTTALSWDHAYSPTTVVRWVSAATITRDTRKFAWSSVLGAYRTFGDRRVLSLEALAIGAQGSHVGALDYGIQTRWSQPVFERRLLGEWTLGHFWPRPDVLTPRRQAWALGGSLKMEF